MAYARVNRARMTTATTGTGTITLGAAVQDASRGYFQSFSAAGVADGDIVGYLIQEGSTWELGYGTYTASGTTLTRNLIASSSGALIALAGAADVSVAPAAGDWSLLSGKGSDTASAGTLVLGDGSYFHVTGTTGPITDIDFGKPWNGRVATLVFDGIVTVTHNATTLKLPGNTNIPTAAGDRMIIAQDADDNIIVLDYIRAAGIDGGDIKTGTVDSARIAGTLTGKTLVDPIITGTVLEDVYTITDGAAFEIDPGNGSIQLITLGANRTPAATNFAAGESVTLMIADGTAFTITWTTVAVTWVGGSAPTLATTGYTVIELWKVGSTIYGARVGDVA